MFLQFQKPDNASKMFVDLSASLSAHFSFLSFLTILVVSLSFVFASPFSYSESLGGGSDRYLEPRLKSRQLEEERLERERQRQALEKQRESDIKKKQDDWRPEHTKDELTEEQKEFEEKKQYMTYWQRIRFAWKYANSFQGIFDQSLSTAYAPAKVVVPFLQIRSGPGRHYPIIYIAERDELIDFTAIRTEWYQVKTEDGHFGWIHMSTLADTLVFEESAEGFGFGDIAVKLETRGALVDIGFSTGFMADDPVLIAFIKNKNSAFFSTEFEYGMSRGELIENDYLMASLSMHPFSEFKTVPYLSVGLGRIKSDYVDASLTNQTDTNLLIKAGLGITQNISPRVKFRADISQFIADSDESKISNFSQLTIGSSYVWGTSTDKVFNRSIGERVKISDTEISLFSGSIGIDHFDTLSLTGLRASYHISEDHFIELSYAQAKNDYSHLSAVLAYNLLPSEFVIRWRNHNNYWPTQVYVLGGSGLQSLDSNEQVSFIAGAGVRVSILRKVAMRLDLRENLIRQQTVNNYIIAKNPELDFGLSYYF